MKQIFSSVAFQDPAGNALTSGTLLLDLFLPCQAITGGQIAPSSVVLALDSSGNLASTNIWANDELNPTTVYMVRMQNSNGLLVAGPIFWSISGTSPIDLSQETPVAPTVSFPGPILANPSAAQTIANFPLTINAGLTLGPSRLNIDGFPSGQAPVVAGNNNDLLIPNQSTVLLSGTAGGSFTVTGMTAGLRGDIVILMNFTNDGQTGTLSLEDANSVATNRFRANRGSPIVLNGNVGSAICIYDGSRWNVVGATPGS